MNRPSALPSKSDRLQVLSAREREIAHLVLRGLSNKAIAHQLGLSIGTVKAHVHRILQKLGAKNRYNLIVDSAAR